jgi:ACS family glucarate transporter-like MFS transporter
VLSCAACALTSIRPLRWNLILPIPVTSDFASAPPSRTRFGVLAFLCVLAFVLYLDRVCISQAVKPIKDELGLSGTQMSFILAAFTLAYGLFEVPTGHWADRIGSRRVLTRISIWWSVFTALTAACGGFWSLLIVRFLFGAGEAGAYPNAARIFSRWFPATERGRAQGLLNFAALVGGASSPAVAAYLIREVGWRWSFVIFGSTGIFWAAAFFAWFRDDPAEHRRVNSGELARIGSPPAKSQEHESIPWRAVFGSRGILLLGLIMTCASCNSYVYFSWFSTYLQEGRGVTPERAGWLSSFVLTGAAIGNLGGGLLADFIMRNSSNHVRARQIFGSIAYVLAAFLLGAGMMCESAENTSILLASSILVMQATLSNWWMCAIEISGQHIGALFGLMNGMGVFGAMGSQFFFGSFSDWRKNHGYLGRDQWDPAFYIVVGVLLVAAVCWQFVDTSRPIDSRKQTEVSV